MHWCRQPFHRAKLLRCRCKICHSPNDSQTFKLILAWIRSDNGTTIVQTYSFDFFNYAGIHRSVVLYTTPTQYIADVITTTNIVDSRGRIFYQVVCNKTEGNKSITINMRDKDGEVVANASSNDMKGYIEIEDVKPWWPYLMHPEPGYLYTMEVKNWRGPIIAALTSQTLIVPICIFQVFLADESGEVIDVYRLKIGVRSLHWNSREFLINGKPIYFRGFGRHEDSDVSFPISTSFWDYFYIPFHVDSRQRTRFGVVDQRLQFDKMDWRKCLSHLSLSIFRGINAICGWARDHDNRWMPKCRHRVRFELKIQHFSVIRIRNLNWNRKLLFVNRNYTPALLEKHKSSIEQLIHRDKNHACVVMWSIANEPRTHHYNADSYFQWDLLLFVFCFSQINLMASTCLRAVANYTKSLDPNRPITAAIAVSVNEDKAVSFAFVRTVKNAHFIHFAWVRRPNFWTSSVLIVTTDGIKILEKLTW